MLDRVIERLGRFNCGEAVDHHTVAVKPAFEKLELVAARQQCAAVLPIDRRGHSLGAGRKAVPRISLGRYCSGHFEDRPER